MADIEKIILEVGLIKRDSVIKWMTAHMGYDHEDAHDMFDEYESSLSKDTREELERNRYANYCDEENEKMYEQYMLECNNAELNKFKSCVDPELLGEYECNQIISKTI